MAKRLVMFDFDGVLANTEELGYYILNDMFKENGIHYSREAFVEMLSGMTNEAFNAYLRAQHPDLPADFEEKMEARLDHMHRHEMKLIDGVRELLDNLKQHNIPFALCSNSGAESLRLKLNLLGLYDDFAPFIFSRHDVENPKPAPDLYELGLAMVNKVFRTNIRPEECIVVEDSVFGTKAGVAAGMTVIGFTGEAHREDHEADMLLLAGAECIAPRMKDTWAYIADMTGVTPRFPYMGPDVPL